MKVLAKHTFSILFIASLFVSCLTTDELSPADENNITGVYYDLIVESDANQGTVTTTPYRIKYAHDDKIILTAKPLEGYDLEDVFREWCSDSYFKFRLDPYYSDYGDVNDEYLHSDFTTKIKEFL